MGRDDNHPLRRDGRKRLDDLVNQTWQEAQFEAAAEFDRQRERQIFSTEAERAEFGARCKSQQAQFETWVEAATEKAEVEEARQEARRVREERAEFERTRREAADAFASVPTLTEVHQRVGRITRSEPSEEPILILSTEDVGVQRSDHTPEEAKAEFLASWASATGANVPVTFTKVPIEIRATLEPGELEEIEASAQRGEMTPSPKALRAVETIRALSQRVLARFNDAAKAGDLARDHKTRADRALSSLQSAQIRIDELAAQISELKSREEELIIERDDAVEHARQTSKELARANDQRGAAKAQTDKDIRVINTIANISKERDAHAHRFNQVRNIVHTAEITEALQRPRVAAGIAMGNALEAVRAIIRPPAEDTTEGSDTE
jgi:hypothetical protein